MTLIEYCSAWSVSFGIASMVALVLGNYSLAISWALASIVNLGFAFGYAVVKSARRKMAQVQMAQRVEDNENYENDLRSEMEQEAHEFAHEQRTERDQVEDAIAGERMVYCTSDSKQDIFCSCFDCPLSGPLAVGKA